MAERDDEPVGPRPLGRPRDQVRTVRLELRPLVAADAESMAAYRSVPEVCRYIPPEPMGPDELRERIEGRWAGLELCKDGDHRLFAVVADGRLVGDVMLAIRSVEHGSGEVGWVLNPEVGGNGYATEAAHAVLHVAFDDVGLRRVVARVDTRNTASARLAARLGMRCEAHLVRNEWFKGEWTDELDFAILDDEFAAQHRDGSSARWCPIP